MSVKSVLRVPRFGRRRPVEAYAVDDWASHVGSELALDLPDEDIVEDLDDCLDLYRFGSKPRCEEIEYLELVREARDRVAGGRP
ncbi:MULTISPECIES: hypothetical protein [unclassified Streptomyces]|uniref:hypothetical protein n=1 Tax=unclassified Streptomyces TaxID=2593676 RepID=UPI00278BBBED|nr:MULTISPECIES: hypothetical protein [unclassified Streptomyces]